MFITKKKFKEALAAEREKAYKESEERCWRADVERRNDDRLCKLEVAVAKLEHNVYHPAKRWPRFGKTHDPNAVYPRNF